MVDFLSGLPGDLAVSPVEKASKRGVVYATALFQPMAANHVKGPIQKCETVNISCVQWMVAGQNGAPGKNAQGAVDVATEPGPELAIIHQLNMVGGPVKEALWK